MSKLVRNEALGNADGGCGIGQIRAQLLDQRLLAFVACQQPAVSGEGSKERKKRKRWTSSHTNESTGIIRSVFSLPRGT